MGVIDTRTAVALCCCLVVAAAPVRGQTTVAGPQGKGEPRTITVTANATTHVKPNAVRLTFVVNTQSQGDVREENDRQVAKVKKGIADLGLKNLEVHVVPASITTVHITDRRVGGFGGGGPAGAMPAVPVQSRQIQTPVVVTLRDQEVERLSRNVTKLVDMAVDNGATGPADETGFRAPRLLGTAYSENFPGPRIERLAENAEEARRLAIKRAVKDATENARAAVGEQTHLQVAAIEITVRDEPQISRRFGRDPQPPETILVPGSVEVRMTFAY